METCSENPAFGPPPEPAEANSPGPHPSPKAWLAGGVAAALFGIGGFFGIQAVTDHSHATTTDNGPGVAGFPRGAGLPGGPGFPGGGPGGFGGPPNT